MTEVPLPGLEEFVKPERYVSQRDAEKARRVHWRGYTLQARVHCYDCIQMRMDGKDVPPKRATLVRTQEGERDAYYCTDHGALRKAREEEDAARSGA